MEDVCIVISSCSEDEEDEIAAEQSIPSLSSAQSVAQPLESGGGARVRTKTPTPSALQTVFQPSSSRLSHLGPTTMSLSSTSVSGWFCSSPLVTQNQNLNINMHPPTSLGSSSSNPFFLKFIQGNIRVCQGCRGSVRKVDSSIPQAPFDLAVARFERRDKTGELRTPTLDQAAHYHIQPSCIQTVSPSFVLTVPVMYSLS